MAAPERIVVLGAGVIGAAIAQALARRGAPPLIVDRVGIAPAASGKAGGFLAEDWNDTTALGPLSRRSFALHRRLATELAADYGYRPVETLQTAGADPATGVRLETAANPEWIDGNVMVHGVLGTRQTTAQVHPRLFTEALIADAMAHGASLRTGVVRAVEAGVVHLDGEDLTAQTVVVAMGPWTGSLDLGLPAVLGLKGSSITLAASVPDQVLFSDFTTADGRRLAPEIYARADEVYVCGVPSADPLPDSPEDVTVDRADCDLLQTMAAGHSGALGEAEVTVRQACFRPVTRDGIPLIGPVPDRDGVYVATGHGPWGILNAPATGEMVAEMILDGGARTLDATAFDPGRTR